MNLLRPLLAAKTTDADLQRLRYPMLLSPKIDGIRALVVEGKLVSRSMKEIPNRHTQALFGRPELDGLDGELVVGSPYDKNLMQQTTSGVMSFGGNPNVMFYVFDRWNSPAEYMHRHNSAVAISDRFMYEGVCPLIHRFVNSYDELLEAEQKYLSHGYEGVMLRDPAGRYKQGRSTVREGILLKVKRFHDAEAVVIDYEPLYRNENAQTLDERGYSKRSTHQANKVADDCLGSVTVRCIQSGQEFSIGSGFTEDQRWNLWAEREGLLGRIVKYKSFKNAGVKDKPRFPIFLCFRDPRDM